MTVCIPLSSQGLSGDVVVCDSHSSMLAHKGIFNFNDAAYVIHSEPVLILKLISRLIERALDDTVNDPGIAINNLHIAVHWETLFCLLLWTEEIPSVNKAYLLLQEAGMTRNDIEPFLTATLHDLFPSLYYSKRFEILRRLCTKTKRHLEQRFPIMKGKILCHLTLREDGIIAASSL